MGENHSRLSSNVPRIETFSFLSWYVECSPFPLRPFFTVHIMPVRIDRAAAAAAPLLERLFLPLRPLYQHHHDQHYLATTSTYDAATATPTYASVAATAATTATITATAATTATTTTDDYCFCVGLEIRSGSSFAGAPRAVRMPWRPPSSGLLGCKRLGARAQSRVLLWRL